MNREDMVRFGAAVLCAFALAGCGRADDDRAVRATTERFLEAVGADDGERACALLSPGAVEAPRVAALALGLAPTPAGAFTDSVRGPDCALAAPASSMAAPRKRVNLFMSNLEWK